METATRLREQPEILELIAVLQKNGMEKEKREVEALTGYLESKESQVGAVLQSLKEVQGQLDAIQNKSLRSRCSRSWTRWKSR